ncbi:hypothetical protein C8J35_101770 [Rhizobium sp. PP-F2F-G38]|nr:hypothetical protein C8J35_101770 [Rhizobium sp. PP-F2F-G38]
MKISNSTPNQLNLFERLKALQNLDTSPRFETAHDEVEPPTSPKVDKSSANLHSKVTREELYRVVWQQPMLRVAKSYGVSGSYMCRVCTSLNVPRPPRGYWAKKAANQLVEVPPLPKETYGKPRIWYLNKAIQGIPLKPFYRRRPAPACYSSSHPLINDAADHFRAAPLGKDSVFVKPRNKRLVDVVTSPGSLERSLAFASQLYSKLERLGSPVSVSLALKRMKQSEQDIGKDCSPYYPTVTFIDNYPIGLTVTETTHVKDVRYIEEGRYILEDDYQSNRKKMPVIGYTRVLKKRVATGHLRVVAYGVAGDDDWHMEWKENGSVPLNNKTDEIIIALQQAALKYGRLP